MNGTWIGLAAATMAASCIASAQVRPVNGADGSQYFCLEAEDFARKEGGWQQTWQGYFAGSPNSWTRNKLEADAGDEPAEARQTIVVERPGSYKLFARYESTYGFGNVFGVRVVQAGKTVFDKKFGFREDRVHMPFGRGCTVMGEWFWHNTELVYTIGDVFNLDQGEAEIIIYKDVNQAPPARRVLDHIFLTTDTNLFDNAGGTVFSTRGAETDKTAPILSKFRKPFWIRLAMKTRAPEPLKIGVAYSWMVNGYWMGPLTVYYPTQTVEGVVWTNEPSGNYWFERRVNPCVQDTFQTDWLRIDAYTVEVPCFKVSCSGAAGGLTFQIADAEPCAKNVIWDGWPDGTNQFEVIVPIGHGFYENQNPLAKGKPLLYQDLLEGQAKAISDYKVPGRPPRLFAACGYPSHSGIPLHQALGLNASFALADPLIYAPENAKRLNTNTNFVYPNSGPAWMSNTNYADLDEATIAKLREEREKDPAGYIPANYKMLEEAGPKGLETLRKDPKHNEAFRAFARERGVDPLNLLTREALAGLVGSNLPPDRLWEKVELGTGSRGESEIYPELYYLSRLYRGRQFAEEFRRYREKLQTVFPRDRINPGSIFISDGYTVALARGVDVFALFRQKGMDSYDSENSWGRDAAAYVGPQSMSYEGAIARALSKYCEVPRGATCTHMLVSGVNGYGENPEYIPLQGLAGFAQGLDMFKYYQIARDCSTALFHLSALKGVKYINYTIGSVEEDLLGVNGRVVPAKVAVGWSISTDIWDLTLAPRHGAESTAMVNNIYPQERHQLYLMLRHCQAPVDVIEERDIEDGLLDGYKVYFLVGDHMSRKAADKLIEWVKAGGTVIAVAGGGLWDEYNRPNPAMLELFGVESAPLQKMDIGLRPKLELLHRAPLDVARFPDGTRIPFYGYRQTLAFPKTNATAEVLAVNEAGKPAVIRRKEGEGAAVLCAFLPGMAYLKPAIPMWPFGRGGRDELSAFSPTNYPPEVRAVFKEMLIRAGIECPVECSEPLVEPTLWKCEDGKHRVCLVNFSLRPIKRLKIVTHGLEYGQVVDVATGRQVAAKTSEFTVDIERFKVLRFE